MGGNSFSCTAVDGLFTISDQLILKNSLHILTLNHNSPFYNLYSYNSFSTF